MWWTTCRKLTTHKGMCTVERDHRGLAMQLMLLPRLSLALLLDLQLMTCRSTVCHLTCSLHAVLPHVGCTRCVEWCSLTAVVVHLWWQNMFLVVRWFDYGFPLVLWCCWLGDRKGIQPVKSLVLVCCWWPFGALHDLQLQLSRHHFHHS